MKKTRPCIEASRSRCSESEPRYVKEVCSAKLVAVLHSFKPQYVVPLGF